MLLEEFEKRTNIFVPGEYFDVIHQFYMDTEMDKDQLNKIAARWLAKAVAQLSFSQ